MSNHRFWLSEEQFAPDRTPRLCQLVAISKSLRVCAVCPLLANSGPYSSDIEQSLLRKFDGEFLADGEPHALIEDVAVEERRIDEQGVARQGFGHVPCCCPQVTKGPASSPSKDIGLGGEFRMLNSIHN